MRRLFRGSGSISCRLSLLIGAAVVILPGEARAQSRDTVEYNWRKDEEVALPRVASGATVVLRITGLNQFCYDYQVSINQVESAHNLPDITKFLGGGLDSVTAPAAPPGADTKNDPMASPLSNASEAERQLTEAESWQGKAHTATVAAVAALNAIVAAATRVQTLTAAFEKYVCPGGTDRGPVVAANDSRLAALTAAVKALLDSLQPRRARAAESLDSATSHLAKARLAEQLVARAGDARSVAFRNSSAARISNLDQGLDALEENVKKTREGPLQQVKSIDARAVTAALAHDSTALSEGSIRRTLVVNDRTDSIVVTIKAKGKETIASVKGPPIDGGFTILVRRRHRVFLSAGFMFSTLDEHSYRRTNLLVPNQPDSTISTFIDRSDNSTTAFAPVVLINMTIGRWLGADMVLSGGVASRKVADRVAPDFLAGLSFGVSDQLVISVLGGMGRVERLLLGDPGSVRRRPVPAAVTFESAVGERWQGQLALAVSYRTR